MATQLGLTLVKRFTYRGNPNEEWSNTYWLTGTPPSTSAAWKTLADGIAGNEASLYLPSSHVVRAYGYNDNADDASSVWSFDYTAAGTEIPGTMTVGTGTYPAGDQAAWLRWRVDRLNSRGRPIYLRKYYHGVPTEEDALATCDQVTAAWRTQALSMATAFSTSMFSGAGHVTARGHTDTILSNAVSTWVTMRQLRKGVRRPPS